MVLRIATMKRVQGTHSIVMDGENYSRVQCRERRLRSDRPLQYWKDRRLVLDDTTASSVLQLLGEASLRRNRAEARRINPCLDEDDSSAKYVCIDYNIKAPESFAGSELNGVSTVELFAFDSRSSETRQAYLEGDTR